MSTTSVSVSFKEVADVRVHDPAALLVRVIYAAINRVAARCRCPLKPCNVVFANDKQPVENWDQPGRLVGDRDIMVTLVQNGAVSHQATLADIAEGLRMVSSSLAAALEPRLRSVVAQMLLHACGQEHFHPSTNETKYFQDLGAQHSGIVQLASSIAQQQQRAAEVDGSQSLPASDMVRHADLICGRNAAAMPACSLAALDQEVCDVRRCIAGVQSELERTCPWECRFLAAYEQLKQAFPQHF